ncbi:MAG: hypothetical protein IRZ10_03000 [Thermoflavifilum sp.]|nr:hypothetical protein [Thermoflavifilum sp.]MCL6513362.1 hypothetical protein [Alicyclobacillus sp.]
MDAVRPPAGSDGGRLPQVSSTRPVRPAEAGAASARTRASGGLRPPTSDGGTDKRPDAPAWPVSPSERVVPPGILRRVEWRYTEWAWRRLMGEGEAVPGQEWAGTATLTVLWRLLEQVASHAGSATTLPADVVRAVDRPSTGPLVEGRHLRHVAHTTLSSPALRTAVADTLLGSVRGPKGEMYGVGYWLPAAVLHEPEGEVRAWPWRGRRTTRVSGDRTVHVLTLRVGEEPRQATVQMVASQPQLWVHVRVADGSWRDRLREAERLVEQGLSACGWKLARWTVGEDEPVDPALAEEDGW